CESCSLERRVVTSSGLSLPALNSGELLKRRVVTKQRFAYQRFEQVAFAQEQLLNTKQRVLTWRLAYHGLNRKGLMERIYEVHQKKTISYGNESPDVNCRRNKGAVQQGPVRARVLNDLSAEEKERYKADIRATNILLQGSSSIENLIESLSNTLALLTQWYKSHLPQTNNKLRASSNARNKAMVQDGKVVV
ncbi:hypothetical protein Tco_1306363, partial [Tanacetum coccineum]